MSKSSENPYISSIFTLLIMCFSQQNHTLNMDCYGNISLRKKYDSEYLKHLVSYPKGNLSWYSPLLALSLRFLYQKLAHNFTPHKMRNNMAKLKFLIQSAQDTLTMYCFSLSHFSIPPSISYFLRHK